MSLFPLGRAVATIGMVASVSAVAITADSESAEAGADVAYEVWMSRPGQSLGDIDVGEPPDSRSDLRGAFEGPQNVGNEYGVRLRSLFTPAVSGNYRFFLSSDDDSRLFVNPLGTDPAGAELTAYVAGWTTPYQWDRFASQATRTLALTAGTSYYIEAIGKEGQGDDHLAVAMQIDDGDITLVPSDLIAATELGAGGWRSRTPYGLDSHPAPSDDPGWQVTNSAHTLGVTWAGVAGAADYEIRLEGSGEARTVTATAPSIEFDNLVPLTRYLLEVTPRGEVGPMAPRTAVLYTDVEEYPTPHDPVAQAGGGVSFDRWDVGWWTLTSIPEGLAPVATTTLTYGLQAPANMGPNLGKRIRAILTPTESGEYTFHLASDDDGRLLFNPDGPTVAGARPIASVAGWTEQYQWDRHASQRSDAFTLEAGEQYYIEAMAVQGLDVDHLEVGWSRPGAAVTVIPNDVLTPTDEGAGGWRAGPVPDVDSQPPAPSTTADVTTTTAAVTTTSTTVPDATTPVTTTLAPTTSGPDTTTTLAPTTSGPDPTAPDTTAPATTTTAPDTMTTVPATTTVPDGEQSPTAAPLYTGEIDMRAYGLLAVGTGPCAGIEMSASSIATSSSIRSNGDVKFWGGNVSVDGPVSYGGETNLPTAVKDAGVVAAGPQFDLSLLADGTALEHVVVHTGTYRPAGPIAAGLHYVDGDVNISRGHLDLTGVSIVATGVINISAGTITMAPTAGSGLPVLMSGSTSCEQAAINLSASTIAWSGTIVALDGMVRMSASTVTGGDIVAAAVRGSASNLTID